LDTISEDAGLANHGYQGIMGPLRCGFAAGNHSGRLQAGSAYYGVFEMSGNLWETVISVCDSGLQFAGNCGDGQLDTEGRANVISWPDPQSANGTGLRGGAWNSGIYVPGSFRDLAISDRFYAGQPAAERRNTSGGRGAR
jgi:formylglycine-generating enzyme required for sulfatase activity